MDRGIPTETHLEEMRRRGACYLVGTPKGRLTKLEQALATRPWQEVRAQVASRDAKQILAQAWHRGRHLFFRSACEWGDSSRLQE